MNKKHTREHLVWNILTLICLLFFGFLFLLPLGKLLFGSIYVDGTITFEAFKRFFATKYYMSGVKNSFKVSTIATLISIVTGTTFAMIVRYFKIKGKKAIDILLLVSTITPPFLGGYAWIVLFGRVGTVTKVLNSLFNTELPGIQGFWGIVFTFVIHSTATMYMYISGALKNVDSTLNEAAENLGCFGLRRIVKIVIPLILPTVLSTALLTFMRCFADYATAKLIGEGYNSMGTLIYNAFMGEVIKDATMPGAMASITLIFTALVFALQSWISSRKIVEMNALHPIEQRNPKGIVAVLSHFYIYLMTFLTILPILVIAYNSFQNTSGFLFLPGFSLNSYRKALDKLGASLGRTYIYAALAIASIVLIAVIVSYTSVRQKSKLSKFTDILTMFPLVVPGTVLGVAMLETFNGKPFHLNGSGFLIVGAWIVRRLPYTIRSTTGVMHNLSSSIEEASQSLGANGFRTFIKVTFPVMFTGILPGALLSFISSITELSTSLMVVSTRNRTIAVQIYYQIAQNSFGVASAMSTILLGSAIIILAILFAFSKGQYEFSL